MKLPMILGSAFSVMLGASAAWSGTLQDVQEHGELKCAVNSGYPGFSATDDAGVWQGFDVQFCRAIAAAVLGDPEAVRFTPVSAKNRFTILQSGEVDVVSRNTTWSVMRDTSQAVEFVGTIYYDGQGFLVRKEIGVNSVLELNDASVCIISASSTEQTLADFFRTNGMTFRSINFNNNSDARKGYVDGVCDVFTGDQSALAAAITTFDDPDNHKVLPEIISKEPLSPFVRHGDSQWEDVVRWVQFALIFAEETGITQANVEDTAGASSDPEVRRFLGVEGDIGPALGLDPKWALNAVKSVGNYGEMWENNIRPLGLDRGLNRLYSDGGLMYAAPFR